MNRSGSSRLRPGVVCGTVALLVTIAALVVVLFGRSADSPTPVQTALAVALKDPLYVDQPPRVGALLRNDEHRSCWSSSQEPFGEKTWVLPEIDSGALIANVYVARAKRLGWTLKARHSIDPRAAFQGRRPSLVFQRESNGETIGLTVDFGRDFFTAKPSMSVAVGVTSATMCAGRPD